MAERLQRLNEINTSNEGYVQVMTDGTGCLLTAGYKEGGFYNAGTQVHLNEQELRSTINLLNTALYKLEYERCFKR